jgi:hypothetical protein
VLRHKPSPQTSSKTDVDCDHMGIRDHTCPFLPLHPQDILLHRTPSLWVIICERKISFLDAHVIIEERTQPTRNVTHSHFPKLCRQRGFAQVHNENTTKAHHFAIVETENTNSRNASLWLCLSWDLADGIALAGDTLPNSMSSAMPPPPSCRIGQPRVCEATYHV